MKLGFALNLFFVIVISTLKTFVLLKRYLCICKQLCVLIDFQS